MKGRRYRFDEVEVDVLNVRVTVDGEIRPLEPKSFRLLVFLIENPNRAVPKEELLGAVWPDVAVSENSLARAITQIRKALDDDPKSPRYVETVPSVGYRFAARLQGERAEPDEQEVEPPALTLPTAKPQDTPGRRTRRRWIISAICVIVALLGAFTWWKSGVRGKSAAPKNFTFTQLTDQPGQEMDPSLAPDGKTLVYASRASGNWDIYSQRIGGKTPLNLTTGSAADDTQPAFSPDGEQIAFRSEREGGGIFVMGATGENVKRISDFGHNPAWSPDGARIVCALTIANPDLRLSSQSQIFTIDVSTGEKRSITPQTGIALQPNWSPHGQRIAYWAQVQGRMDVGTIPAGGGPPVMVTADAAVDWNPVWSPDGAYLYFASDRGGSMNVWRVAIDEATGKVRGAMEPVTTPSSYSSSISFSRSGREMAYLQRRETSNIYRVKFDEAKETAIGQPIPVTRGTRHASTASVSPDGEWVVFHDTRGHDSLYVVRADGTGQQQLTNDRYYSRRPVWSPDGQTVAFFSNRGGKFDIWSIRPDGGGLRQLTDTPHISITHPVWSPDGKRLVYSLQNGTPFAIDAGKPWANQLPLSLPALNEPDTWFEAASWSPDGSKLAGFQLRADGKFTGIDVYSFETGGYTRITEFGQDPCWLKDGRRLILTRGIPRDSASLLSGWRIAESAPDFVGGAKRGWRGGDFAG